VKHHHFDEAHIIHELKHFLPSQQALKDFIHHNSLHAFQHMKFYDAIFKASKIFGFQVHLQLPEYRELYQTGRIRRDILEMVITNKKGKEAVVEWQQRLISKDYDTINHPGLVNCVNTGKRFIILISTTEFIHYCFVFFVSF
jgi:hypothetical protein